MIGHAGRSATNPTTQSQRTTTQAAEQADPARGDARAEAPATSSARMKKLRQ